jgi:hypothetical protein
MYLRDLQRLESQLGYLHYNVYQVHRRYNLANLALNRVPDVILAARLKHVWTVAGLSGAAHDRLGRFQAVMFGHVITPEEELLVKILFVCCPALWWNYLRPSSAE